MSKPDSVLVIWPTALWLWMGPQPEGLKDGLDDTYLNPTVLMGPRWGSELPLVPDGCAYLEPRGPLQGKLWPYVAEGPMGP